MKKAFVLLSFIALIFSLPVIASDGKWTIAGTIDGLMDPTGITYDGNWIWATEQHAGSTPLYRINPTTMTIEETIYINAPSCCVQGLAWDGQFIWISGNGYKMYRFDPITHDLQQTCTRPSNPQVTGLTAIGSIVYATGWYGATDDCDLMAFDPNNCDYIALTKLPSIAAHGLAWTGSNFLVCMRDHEDPPSALRRTLYKYSTTGEQLARYEPFEFHAYDIAWDGEFVWVCDYGSQGVRDGNIHKIRLMESVVQASLDIKPGSCPNPLNVKPFTSPPVNAKSKKGGVLPVALLGTAEFDVQSIDVSTVMLENVEPLRHSYEDVATPTNDADECACTEDGPDGFMDLTLKFAKSDIGAALGAVSNGDIVPLTITGVLYDGTVFQAMDCIIVRGVKIPAKVCLVNPDGSGDFPTIQAAIDAGYETIELGDGIFTGDGNRDIDFGGRSITVRSHSGNAEDCIIDCGGSSGEHHRGFYFHSDEGPEAVLKNITITNGFITGSGEENNGAGIFCNASSPTIDGCIIAFNICGSNGGGIAIYNESSPVIRHCLINYNSAHDGGGIGCYSNSTPVIHHCEISYNTTQGHGAGINCAQSMPNITECRIHNNQTFGDGVGGGIQAFESVPMLVDSRIEANTARNGGGIYYAMCADTRVINCEILFNEARHVAGGILCSNNNRIFELTGCVINGNKANSRANAMYCLNDNIAEVTSCTFAGNEGGSGAVYVYDGGVLNMTRSIVAFNNGRGLVCDGTDDPIEVSVACCDIYANSGGDVICGVDMGDNFSADPMFCDLSSGNVSLQHGSPCLPGNHPDGADCDLIGALGEDCASIRKPDPHPLPNFGEIELRPAKPNPFNPITRISYLLPGERFVTLSVYDVTGRLVVRLVNEVQSSGEHAVEWNATDLPSGVYFYRIQAGDFLQTRKLILLK